MPRKRPASSNPRRSNKRAAPSWAFFHADLEALHAAAIRAADPASAVARALRLDGRQLRVGHRTVEIFPASRVWLLAFGKASVGMARGALSVLEPLEVRGVVAHPRGFDPGDGWPETIRPIAAGHPLPDEGSLRAGSEALELLEDVGPEDVALVLVSGGGSALFEALRPGIALQDVREITRALQHAGADIMELNVVRRAISRIKGGGLARAAGPARVVTLVLSDVVGDRPEAVASGPTVDSPTGLRDAIEVLERRGLLETVPGVMKALREAGRAETGGRAAPDRILYIAGSNLIAGEAVCAEAERRGFQTMLLTDRLQGEAREVGRLVGGIARGMSERGRPLSGPACLVLGGETTVTVRGNGRGGRNLELALGAALSLDGCPHTAVFSFATDGVDGSSGAAGAVATGETVARASALGLSVHRALEDNDTEPLFRALQDLWVTGPSGTNVNDLVVAIVYP